ncbi:MAG: thioredoxin family protein [Bacilli bacterium]|nr:thioredoxin family protein [Bacilli bacterium]
MEKIELSLNQIKLCLYVLITLMLVLIITVIAVNGDTKTSNTNTEQTTGEYDISEFTSVDVNGFMSEIKKDGYQVVYIGRATCSYCVKFIPTMQEAQEKFNYKTIYFDITQVIDFTTSEISDEEGYNKIVALDSYVSKNFGSTPMILVFKDGKYINGWVGYSEYDDFADFLTESGLTTK